MSHIKTLVESTDLSGTWIPYPILISPETYTRARASEPVKSPCGKWEVTPRKYYDTLNVVVVLKGKTDCSDTGDKI